MGVACIGLGCHIIQLATQTAEVCLIACSVSNFGVGILYCKDSSNNKYASRRVEKILVVGFSVMSGEQILVVGLLVGILL
jgi:hypothetical protein